MSRHFIALTSTDSVRAARELNGVHMRSGANRDDSAPDRFGEGEAAFITARDSFYLSSVSESGWPYVQHRGGPAGFLKVLDDRTLGFLDFRGNRQYLSLGNSMADDRVALILVDYATRTRLKILAHMASRDLASDLDLARRLSLPDYPGRPERAFILTLEAFDWNCQQHITPRFTLDEIEAGMAPLHQRIAALEAENAVLRAK